MKALFVIDQPKGKLEVPVKGKALSSFEAHACKLYRVYQKCVERFEE
jgi:hypothetical protein